MGRVSELSDLNPGVWKKAKAPERVRYLDLKSVKWGVFSDYREYEFADAPSRARNRGHRRWRRWPPPPARCRWGKRDES